MTKVIDFAEAKERLRKSKKNDEVPLDEFSLSYALMVARDILFFLEDIGYDLHLDEDLVYDMMMLIEINKSIIYRLHGKKHKMHRVGQDLFWVEEPRKALTEILKDLMKE